MTIQDLCRRALAIVTGPIAAGSYFLGQRSPGCVNAPPFQLIGDTLASKHLHQAKVDGAHTGGVLRPSV